MVSERKPGGEYVLHLWLPRAIEDAARARPGWASEAARLAVEAHGAGVEFRGAGLGWHDAELVYMVRVRVLTEAEQPLEVEHAGVAIPVAALVAIIAAALALASIQLRRTVELIPPDDRGAVARGIGDVGRAALNMSIIAAGIAGLLALERHGVLTRG